MKQKMNGMIVFVAFLCLISVSTASAELDWVRVVTEYTPPKIDGHQMVFDLSNEISIVFGSYSTSRALPLHTYDGSNWYRIDPSGDWPSSRSHFGMAYDADREVVVVFGGFQGGFDYLGDTWEWDGTQWEEKFPVHSPTDRIHHSMVYTDTSGLILYGGYTEDLVRTDELWTWDGVNWSEVACTVFPDPARTGSQLAYDPVRDRIILFGGTNNGNTELSDTWEWDEVGWTQIMTEDSPSGKRNHCLVYDAARQRTVLFGGNDDPYGFSDRTWEYDGQNWTQVFPSHHPFERGQSAACFDSARERIVLYGGYTASGSQNDTWEYYNVLPTPTPTPPSPCTTSGVVLTMPSENYRPGDPCWLQASLCLDPHPGDALPFFLILEAYGNYFYYPSWSDAPDFESRTVPVDGEHLEVFPLFDWPDNAGSGEAIFYGAFTNPEMTSLTGELGIWDIQWTQ